MGGTTHSISALCTEFGVTPRTLRFYEARGLLGPAREGQRRLYSARDRARLTLILKGRRFGFALDEMRELLDLYDLGDQGRTQGRRTVDIAERRLAGMEARRAGPDAVIEELRGLIAAGRFQQDHRTCAA